MSETRPDTRPGWRPLGRCADISALVSASMDSDLSRTEGLRVRMHLWICVHCRAFASQVQSLRGLLRNPPETPDPPHEH